MARLASAAIGLLQDYDLLYAAMCTHPPPPLPHPLQQCAAMHPSGKLPCAITNDDRHNKLDCLKQATDGNSELTSDKAIPEPLCLTWLTPLCKQ